MSFALKVTEISKSFPGVLANDKISIEIPNGTIHAIVGENGAGKSTLMKVIYGMISPDSGTITVEDEEKGSVFSQSGRNSYIDETSRSQGKDHYERCQGDWFQIDSR